MFDQFEELAVDSGQSELLPLVEELDDDEDELLPVRDIDEAVDGRVAVVILVHCG